MVLSSGAVRMWQDRKQLQASHQASSSSEELCIQLSIYDTKKGLFRQNLK